MAQVDLDTKQAATVATEIPARTLGLKAAAMLFVLALVVLLPGIHVSLFDRDEGWYAQVCREMLTSGDWLVPRYLGKVWLAKPPLTYWLVTASFWLFGVGEWQARLAPVLMTAINVVLVAALGARIFGRRVGLLAGVLFITAGLPIVVGKMLLTDQAMLLCTLCAVYLHWRMASGTEGQRDRGTEGRFQSAIRNPQSAIHPLAAGYWVAIGLGILAKGPATLVFAGAFGLALLLTPGRREWIRDWRYWIWLPVALLVAAPWYVHIAQQAGDTLSEQFLSYEISERIAGTPHGHGGPPGYYLLLSLAGLLPWIVFVPGTLIIAFRRRREDSTLRLLLIWLAVPWVVLELIHAKLPHYILPCYVPLMILLARSLEEGLRRSFPLSGYPRNEQRVLGAWPVIMIGMGIVAIAAALIRWDARWGWSAIATGVVLIAGFVAVDRMLRRSFARAFVAAVGATVAFHVAAGLLLFPSLEPFRLSRNLAQTVNATARPGEHIALCGYEEPSTFFYLRQPGQTVKRDSLAGWIDNSAFSGGILVITERELSRLSEGVAQTLKNTRCQTPVSGFNYVKMAPETLWLVRTGNTATQPIP